MMVKTARGSSPRKLILQKNFGRNYDVQCRIPEDGIEKKRKWRLKNKMQKIDIRRHHKNLNFDS